jgi:gamma-glutamyltranspeptidase/glutathione hydrolase
VHVQIEAIELAFADALAYVSDLEYIRLRPAQLLDEN